VRPCPYCSQAIGDYAQVCPFCRSNLVGTSNVPGQAETSGKAIGSLVCGFLFFFPPSAILAVIMGHLSLSEIRRSAGRLCGRGVAIAGLVLGYMGLSFIPILIIAAIAIPNLLRAKMAANEASTVASLRTYNTVLLRYATECPKQGYPPDATYIELEDSDAVTCPQAQEGLRNVPKAGALPMKSGYRFFYIPMQYDGEGHISKYGLSADPVTPGATGAKHFYTDETGVIRFTLRGGADSKSPPVPSKSPPVQ
jgi:type IV pilus assembly protein PilA